MDRLAAIAQAAILVGGRGTRLGPLTDALPKPMVDVAGRPFLDYLIDEVARFGLARITLLCGYRAERIAERYDGRVVGETRIECVVETTPLGTGGALVNATGYLDERFFILNGDTIFAFNLLDLALRHGDGRTLATMALRAAPPGARFGSVEWDGDRVTGFAARGTAPLINGGVYVLERSLLGRIAKLPCSIEADIFPDLARDGLLGGVLYDGFFLDIGVPESLREGQTSIPAQRRRPAVFLRGDGVLNRAIHHPERIARWEWVDGAHHVVKVLNDCGYYVFVMTGPAGPARHDSEEAGLRELHHCINAQLAKAGAHIDAFFDRVDVAGGLAKPALAGSRDQWPVVAEASFLVGASLADLDAAAAVGIRGILYDGSKPLDRFLEPMLPAGRPLG